MVGVLANGMVMFDFNTALDVPPTRDGAPMLNTNGQRLTGMMRQREGYLLQVLPDEPADGLLEAHRAAVARLGESGVGARARNLDETLDAMRAGSRATRRAMLRSPLRSTLTLLVRSLTKRSPHHAPLFEQRGVEHRIARLSGPAPTGGPPAQF